MLSYIHAFHAGNHGDILKHLVFSIVLEHLLKKDKPFTVIDTHSAAGRYKLFDERLEKTGEAKEGILKLLNSPHFSEFSSSSKYFEIAKQYIKKNLYPGSPELARCFMRKTDELILNELHPQVIEDLRQNMKLNLETEKEELPQIIINNKKADAMLKAFVPPKIKRGCVIIDPSYEDSSDFAETTEMFLTAYKKWNTGTYLIWYPLLEHRASEIERMKESIECAVERVNAGNNDVKSLFFELKVKESNEMTGLAKLYGSGMAVINPPYGLNEKMTALLPKLEEILKS